MTTNDHLILSHTFHKSEDSVRNHPDGGHVPPCTHNDLTITVTMSDDPDMVELWENGPRRKYLLAVVHKDFFMMYSKPLSDGHQLQFTLIPKEV